MLPVDRRGRIGTVHTSIDSSSNGRLTRRAVLAIPLLAGLATLAGCSDSGKKSSTTSPGGIQQLIAWPAKNEWPSALTSMPQPIQTNYHDAVAHKAVLQYIPCYCGCYANGHTCVYDCYVAEERSDGSIILDTMSFG
jgi:hypothetical protein